MPEKSPSAGVSRQLPAATARVRHQRDVLHRSPPPPPPLAQKPAGAVDNRGRRELKHFDGNVHFPGGETDPEPY
jgi:hypothetical protein